MTSAPKPSSSLETTSASDDGYNFFQGRDGAAFNELAAKLPPLGYQYGATIHFDPNANPALSWLKSSSNSLSPTAP